MNPALIDNFRGILKNKQLQQKSVDSKESVDFDKLLYFIDRINEINIPKHIVDRNPNYCKTVLETIADEYLNIVSYLEFCKNDNDKTLKLYGEALDSECKERIQKAWINFCNIDAPREAKEETEKIIEKIDLKTGIENELGLKYIDLENMFNIYLTDQGKTIQITASSKLKGIEKIRQKLGLQMDEIAVFGDDINDIEMLSHYPNSVAMGNGADEVKRIASYTTDSNDADGIAHALQKLILA
jgi:hydroxymethylpyrimidine pyrophosphatase-like HAD family hydrolase